MTQEIITRLAEMCGALAVAMLLALSPRISTVAPVGFKYPKREIKFSLAVAAFLLIFVNFFYFFGSSWLRADSFNFSPSLDDLLKLSFAALIAVFVAILLTRYRGQPFHSMGWHKNLIRPAIQFGLALIMLTLFLRGEFLGLFKGIPQDAINALILCLVIALAEESVFRGYIQMRLLAFFGKYLGWGISSIIFVVWRLPFLSVLGWGSQAFWVSLGLLTLQSLLLGWIMVKSRHVLVSGLYHAFSMWIAFL